MDNNKIGDNKVYKVDSNRFLDDLIRATDKLTKGQVKSLFTGGIFGAATCGTAAVLYCSFTGNDVGEGMKIGMIYGGAVGAFLTVALKTAKYLADYAASSIPKN